MEVVVIIHARGVRLGGGSIRLIVAGCSNPHPRRQASAARDERDRPALAAAGYGALLVLAVTGVRSLARLQRGHSPFQTVLWVKVGSPPASCCSRTLHLRLRSALRRRLREERPQVSRAHRRRQLDQPCINPDRAGAGACAPRQLGVRGQSQICPLGHARVRPLCLARQRFRSACGGRGQRPSGTTSRQAAWRRLYSARSIIAAHARHVERRTRPPRALSRERSSEATYASSAVELRIGREQVLVELVGGSRSAARSMIEESARAGSFVQPC